MDTDSNNLFPSRSELACKSLFSATPEERELAKWLLSQTAERKDDEHAWEVLDRLYPPGSEAEKLLEQTPTGQSVLEFCQLQPGEDEPEYSSELMESIEEAIDNLPEPPAPAPAPVSDLEQLEQRTSLASRIKEHGSEGVPIVKPPKPIDFDWGPGGGQLF
jgi:hypothetical protein